MFEGNLVRLVVLEENHLDHIVENWNNPEMRRFLGGVIPHSRQSEVDWLQSVQDDMKRQKMFAFAIERLSNDAFLHQQFYIDGEYVDSAMMEIFRLDTQDW